MLLRAVAVWTRREIAVRIFAKLAINDDERVNRDGYVSDQTPGLVIVETDLGPRTGLSVPWIAYSVTHEPSGRALAKWFTRLDAAKTFTFDVFALTDWTDADADAYRKNEQLAADVVALRRQHYEQDALAAALPESGVSINFLAAIERLRKREHRDYNDAKSRAGLHMGNPQQ